jgi:hypothetical protein
LSHLNWYKSGRAFHILFDLFGATELQTREPTGLDFGNAGSHLVGDLRFDVKLDFLVQIALHALARE